MAESIDVAVVKSNYQLTITKKMRDILKVEENDYVGAYRSKEMPNAILLVKVKATFEPDK